MSDSETAENLEQVSPRPEGSEEEEDRVDSETSKEKEYSKEREALGPASASGVEEVAPEPKEDSRQWEAQEPGPSKEEEIPKEEGHFTFSMDKEPPQFPDSDYRAFNGSDPDASDPPSRYQAKTTDPEKQARSQARAEARRTRRTLRLQQQKGEQQHYRLDVAEDSSDESSIDENFDAVSLTESESENLTWRGRMQHALHNHWFHIIIIILVSLDAFIVIFELLIEVGAFNDEALGINPGEVLHILSLLILSTFLVEIVLKLVAFRLKYFTHKFEVFDGTVVVISWILDVASIVEEEAFEAASLIIVLRLWRVVRIVNGALLSSKAQTDRDLEKSRAAARKIIHALHKAQDKMDDLETENFQLKGKGFKKVH